MKKIVGAGFGSVSVLSALCLALPFMVAAGSDAPVGAAGPPAVGGPVPPGKARALPWRALFDWTPPTGEPVGTSWPWGQCTWFVVTEGHAGGDHQVHWS